MFDRRPDFFREELPPGRQVEAKVKWFNASKGFGFVTMADGSQDAFLPMAILRRAGYEDVREGASISCEVSAGAKGPLVTNVLNIDNSTAVAPGAGSYVSESNFFEEWRDAYWGANDPRLLAIKDRYDPDGLFFVHHGVGSERWSADGFTRLA